MNIKNDPIVSSLMKKMPKKVQESFTDEQLMHLKVAIGARQWGKHKVDCRHVLKVFKYRYYFVFIAGRNRRKLSTQEERTILLGNAITVTLITLISLSLLLIVLYLIKSAIGVDIFPSFSLGFWTWLNET